jgi:hypothetical protein
MVLLGSMPSLPFLSVILEFNFMGQNVVPGERKGERASERVKVRQKL